LSPGPYQAYSFWLVRSKLMKFGLIFLIRYLRKKLLFKNFQKWERQHGARYFTDPEQLKEIEKFYKDNPDMKNPYKDVPKITKFR